MPLRSIALILLLGTLPAGASAQPVSRLGLLDSVRGALTRNPAILVSARQVDISRGQLQQATGQFDSVLSASAQSQRNYTVLTPAGKVSALPAVIDSTIADQTTSTLGFSQLLRNGVTVSPAISLTRATDNSAASVLSPAPNRSTVGLNVTIPLLRNSGQEAVGAAENAARKEVEAVRLDLAHTVSLTALNVVSAYWAYLAAERGRDVAVAAESGAQQRERDTDKLVQAEVLPASERELVRADSASKRLSRIAAEQALVEARGALARFMGLTAEESHALPLPAEDFPDATAVRGDVVARVEAIRKLALERRADYLAAGLRYAASEISIVAARNSLKPQVDLVLGVGVSGLREGNSIGNFIGAGGANLHGPNATVGLSYQFPVQNNAAAGILSQRLGALDQIEIGRRELRYAILTSIETLALSVQRLGLQLDDAKRAVALYGKAVENEEVLRKLGRGTLINILNVSDRLLLARQSLTAVQLNYATAIAQLRHASGALWEGNAGGPAELTLELGNLVTAP